MSTPKQTIYETMRDDVNITALVSERVYPQVAPEGTKSPFIVYRELATGGLRTLGGVLVDEWSDYDLFLVADTPEELLQLTSAVMIADWPSNVVAKPVIGSDGYDFDHDRYTKTIELMITL